jgi:hypothetical protein
MKDLWADIPFGMAWWKTNELVSPMAQLGRPVDLYPLWHNFGKTNGFASPMAQPG